MASAIGASTVYDDSSMISTILRPMADKAMGIVEAMVLDKVDFIANIEGDISSLLCTLCVIEGIVHEAENKQINNVYIKNWLRDLVDIGYEARDVLDDFINFSSCDITEEEDSNPVNFISSLMLSCFCCDTSNRPLATLNQLEKDIKCVKERFDDKKKEAENFKTLISVVGGGGSESVRVDHRPEVGPSINRDALFLGRDEVKEGIMEKILNLSDDNRVHAVAIWGMGGIGKTTLAQSIYNDERVKEDNYPTKNRRWLCVGENKFNAKEIIMKIIDDSSTTNNVESLHKKLVEKFRDDRFLIVLDDVWDVDGSEWDLLFNPLTNVGKGGLIIITTRMRMVCTATNTQTTYCLMPLSKEDSWSLFESCAYKDGKSDSTSELKRIGEEIVKKLNGLPLALKVVGCSLLDKDSITWTNFLESKLTMDGEVMSALRWSYNHLPRHLKMCFTYCALFPKDHVLDKKVLVEMWMAHDLIQTNGDRRPEDIGAKYFQELTYASLIQYVDKRYMMHDMIHDLALHVSNEEFSSTVGSLSTAQKKKVRHITIANDDEYSKNLSLCKSKRILTVYTPFTYRRPSSTPPFVSNDILLEVFKQSKSLRVLVLCSYDIKEIPDCISELRHLRYLDVSRTSVKSLPDSLCHLYNLQMLAIPFIELQLNNTILGNVVNILANLQMLALPFIDLPRDAVNMVNLRYIRANLSTCNGVGKLTSLQELSSIRVCEGDNIRELGDMQRLRGKLRIKGLENVTSSEDAAGALMEKQTLMDELILEFDKEFVEPTISEEVLDALGCPPNLTHLQIHGYTGVKPPSWMVDGKHKFHKLQTLELTYCPKLESLPPLGELTSLKRLCLWNVGVKRLREEFYGKITDGKVFFSSLESLCFYYMEEWEEWDDIVIKNSSVSFFPHLTRLEIEHCANLVSVLPVVKNCTSQHYLQTLELSSLKSLHIEDCPQLQSLPPNFDKLSSLEELYIKSCPQLQSLPRDFHKLSSLKKLSIEDYPQFQSLPPNFHKLSSLERLEIESCPQLQSLPQDFHKLSSLDTLIINGCPKLRSLPPYFHMLSSLKGLYIKNCPQLQLSIPYFKKFSSLDELHIISRPQDQSLKRSIHSLVIAYQRSLEERCELESSHDWHQIKHIRNLWLLAGNFIMVSGGTLGHYRDDDEEE